jgi:hypothetical protein
MAFTVIHNDIVDDDSKHMPFGYSTQALWDATRIRYAEITLTSGQVNASAGTPIQIVAAPGADKAFIPLYAASVREAGTAYTTGGNISVYFNNGAASTSVIAVNNSALTSTSKYYSLDAVGSNYFSTYVGGNHINTDLSLKATAAISGGAGTIKVKVWYILIDFS